MYPFLKATIYMFSLHQLIRLIIWCITVLKYNYQKRTIYEILYVKISVKIKYKIYFLIAL